MALSVTMDGGTLLSGSADCTARLWHINSRQCIRTLSYKGKQIGFFCFLYLKITKTCKRDLGSFLASPCFYQFHNKLSLFVENFTLKHFDIIQKLKHHNVKDRLNVLQTYIFNQFSVYNDMIYLKIDVVGWFLH